MPALIDLTGQKFGRLQVIQRDFSKNQEGKRGTFWLCKCECNNEVVVNSINLKNGGTQSCGCLQKERAAANSFKDIVGMRFGRLIVLERGETKTGETRAYWKCLCDCGKETIVSGKQLRSGKTQSCGCLRLENLRKKCANNLKGQQFGILTVLEVDEDYKKINNLSSRKLYWRCRCDCGSIVSIEGSHLTRGDTQSCGCIISRGEEKIAELLSKNNIPFEKQKTFNTCILPSGYKARFDFYVNNSFLIEFDGVQHFEVFGRTDELELENIKNKDAYKNNWCKINGIPLKRIPYLDIKKFTFEDLMSDKYLINKE